MTFTVWLWYHLSLYDDDYDSLQEAFDSVVSHVENCYEYGVPVGISHDGIMIANERDRDAMRNEESRELRFKILEQRVADKFSVRLADERAQDRFERSLKTAL